MQFYDNHIHSNYSFDCKEDMEKTCIYALSIGVKSICFTEHFDCNYPSKDRVNLETYKNEFLILKNKFENKLQLCFGIEIGQALENVELCNKILSVQDFDEVLTSVHNLPFKEDFFFLDYEKENTPKLLTQYFDHLLDTAKNTDYDILSHLDYPVRYMKASEELLNPHKEVIAEILRTVISRGKVLEVNTSNVDKKLGGTMPSTEIVKLYRDLGGTAVSTGSDAHVADRVAVNFREIYSLLQNIGIKYIAAFERRNCSLIPLL